MLETEQLSLGGVIRTVLKQKIFARPVEGRRVIATRVFTVRLRERHHYHMYSAVLESKGCAAAPHSLRRDSECMHIQLKTCRCP